MIISIASGKGGTGKTTIATSLALSIGRNVQFLDCDVEEPNARIFLKPQIEKVEKVTVLVPEVDENKCDFCGKCSEVCEYNAIVVAKNKVLIFPELCHSCGGCVLFCPQKAIAEKEREIGKIEVGKAGDIGFISGILNVGEAMPVPMVSAVKRKINKEKSVIIDVSPGTSCPVVEAVKYSDYCILVTESTPFGLSDLKLAMGVLAKMKIPCGIVINKYDSTYTKTEEFCKQQDIPVLLKIPEDRKIAESYSKGEPLVKALPEYKNEFVKMLERIKK
ncbi:MAG: ATP-binding protein [Candidatus Margulisiibacteriota bacterium]